MSKQITKKQRRHRLGCTNDKMRLAGIRTMNGEVLLFCYECYRSLVNGDVYDPVARDNDNI
jgi:hypothetical protein